MEYIENPEADWRKQKLLEVRDLILRNAGDIGEGIEYKMLCYGYEGKNIFHLNAQRVYVSLYVVNIGKWPVQIKCWAISTGAKAAFA